MAIDHELNFTDAALGHGNGKSTIIVGGSNRTQAEMNMAVSDLPILTDDLLCKLRNDSWMRSF
jgi:aryl-alcohol dehydrogenase-like predicted oxidoreductase